MGRPSKYTPETADKICDRISTSSDSLSKICNELDVSTVSVFRWLEDSEEFRNLYARAREAQADFLADEILEISDQDADDEKPFVGVNHIQRDRLKIDARKWIASKLKPKKYGDKLDVTTDGDKLVFNVGYKKQTPDSGD